MPLADAEDGVPDLIERGSLDNVKKDHHVSFLADRKTPRYLVWKNRKPSKPSPAFRRR
jgi:hypothetical protein